MLCLWISGYSHQLGHRIFVSASRSRTAKEARIDRHTPNSDRPPELSGPPSLHHLSKVSQFRRARKEAGASYTKSKNDFTTYQKDVDRSMSRQPPAVSPGVPALPPMMMADSTLPRNSVEYASGFGATPSGVDSNLGNNAWNAPPGGDATTEDYTQVAEDMSSYLIQTGMDPLLWWDLETFDSMA